MSKNIGLTSCLYCSERACQVAYDAIEEITRLRSDLATLRAENYDTQSLLKGAEAECEALRADAERYRWLRECARATSEHWGGRWSLVIEGPAPESNALPAGIDAAIDAARAREPK